MQCSTPSRALVVQCCDQPLGGREGSAGRKTDFSRLSGEDFFCPVDISESIRLILERARQTVDFKTKCCRLPKLFRWGVKQSISKPHLSPTLQCHTPSLNEPSQRIRRRPRWKDLSLKILILTVQWSWLQHWKWTYKLLPMSVNIEKKNIGVNWKRKRLGRIILPDWWDQQINDNKYYKTTILITIPKHFDHQCTGPCVVAVFSCSIQN